MDLVSSTSYITEHSELDEKMRFNRTTGAMDKFWDYLYV